MYADYFSLIEKPFSITPDPAYLFLSKRHEEALAHLLYGVTDSGGFIQLTGEVGTGKTTIIRSLFERIPENVEIALILNPRLSENEFLHAICDELLITVPERGSNKECFDALNKYLLDAHSQGQKIVLLVDEAQNLAVNVLEYIRLLTNLETDKDKLLQIILVGQPELQTLLNRQDLRQLAQRITARYHLVPLNKVETDAYINHRLEVAGSTEDIFTKAAKGKIFTAAKGIPRLINVLSDRALLGAYSQEKSKVDGKLAKQVIQEVLGQQVNTGRTHSFLKWFPLAGVLAAAMFMLSYWLLNANSVMNVDLKKLQQTKSKVDEVNAHQSSSIDELVSFQKKISNEISVEDSVLSKQESATLIYPEIESLTNVLKRNFSETTAEKSVQKLLTLWGKQSAIAFDDVCRKVMSLNLRCLYRNAQWKDIITINRPLIIEVSDDKQIIHHLLVKQADTEHALVLLGEKEILISLSDILPNWQGDYLLFWEPDREFLDASLQIGSNGPAVQWLKEQLGVLNITPKTNKSNLYFGGVTMLQVKEFQKRYNLSVDGVVGRETFIAINNALNLPGRPKLIQNKLLVGEK